MGAVTVVVPSYNRADLLRETLRSILAQTVRGSEVIVVDDGSTDHTPQVCAEFGDAIKVIRQKNSGLPAARNAGIQAAASDWIAFCDSDDLWLPHKLEVQLAALEATGAKWSISDFHVIGADGVKTGRAKSGFQHAFAIFHETRVLPARHFGRWLAHQSLRAGATRTSVYFGDAFGLLFEGNVALPSTSIVSRKLIEQVGMFDRTFRAEETEFFHRVAAQGSVAVVMEPLVEYRVGHASLINVAPDGFIQDALKSIELASRLRPGLTVRELKALRSGRRRLRLRLAYARLASLDTKGARRALFDAWKEDPTIAPRSTIMMMASLLPAFALRGLHWAKRTIASQLG